jgi:hypothetical protein
MESKCKDCKHFMKVTAECIDTEDESTQIYCLRNMMVFEEVQKRLGGRTRRWTVDGIPLITTCTQHEPKQSQQLNG